MKKLIWAFPLVVLVTGIFLFRGKDDPDGGARSVPIVKRVIGKAGDRIEIRKGVVYINGIRQKN